MPRFLVTISVGLVLLLFIISYIIFKIPPNSFYLAILIVLIGIATNLALSIVFYFFSRPRGFESERSVYHRAFKKASIVALVVVWLLIAQVIWDVL